MSGKCVPVIFNLSCVFLSIQENHEGICIGKLFDTKCGGSTGNRDQLQGETSSSAAI